jgi:hypothetical protein
MGHEEIDSLLAGLDRPSSVDRRLEILDRLIAYWHGERDPAIRRGEDELRGCRAPLPLRWLYERGIDRTGVLSRQNQLIGPDGLESDRGYVVFYVENQGVYLWGIAEEEERAESPDQLWLPFIEAAPSRAAEPQDDDPPVWGRFNEEDESWEPESVRLSEFLIQACLFEAIQSAPHGAWASWAPRQVLDRVTAPLGPVPLAAWRWPSHPHRFWAGGGVFVSACPNSVVHGELGYTIHAGARTEQALGALKPIVDRSWEHRTF